MSNTINDLEPGSDGSCDPIDELEILVHGLRDTNTKDDFYVKIAAINKKIDIIREAVERLCEITSECVEATVCSFPESSNKTKLN